MKNLLAFFLVFISLNVISQTKKDTTTILYSSSWQEIKTGNPAYVGLVWKEGNKWHKQDYYYPQSTLQMDGLFSDKDLKTKDGLFTWYHKNGVMSDSCLYVAMQHEGTQITWDEEGNQASILHWHNDLPIDTAVWWNKNGGITAVQITDNLGNGLYQSYLDDGKTIRIKGRLMAGKRSGKWIFKDSKGTPGVDAVYLADSVISAICYDELGQIETGKTDCRVEKQAAFKGGNDGWRRYLERSLVYPEDAVKNNIQGVVSVEFIIEPDGSVSNAIVLGSPDKLLAAEALRMIKKSPKWEPAIQYNRQIISRHVQSITFAFQ